jgi:NhaP-type Na+/H+ or K+/H+ antiporter
MHDAIAHTAPLTLALALAAGVASQALARHLRVPGIVVLLAAGVALGPGGLGLILPDTLGDGLAEIVGFAVAIILFEGGLNLRLSRLRRQGRMVRRLLTIGALITLVGGALSARFVLGWDWRLSLLFGSLVIVTGPTVITPLLRRVRVRRRIETVLEAEGVLIDAVGAIAAVVLLEVLLHPSGTGAAAGLTEFGLRFAVGIPMGLAGGLLIGGLLRTDRFIPEGLENVFVLSSVLALWEIGDTLMPEMGLVTVTVAGLVVGNLRTRVSEDLAEFKEQLTVMLIGLLFILLAANVRLEDVSGLGWPGLGVVALLVLVVRPVEVAVCAVGTDLDARDRAFIGWVAPRGIVAAAIASLFARSLEAAGLPGGPRLVALVFLVIAVTVAVQGLTMGPVARLLGVARGGNRGFVILGANGLAMALARALLRCGEEVVLIESSAERANRARDARLPVVFGNGLEESVALRAQPDTRAAGIALTSNEEANLLFARRLRERYGCPRALVAIDRVTGHLTADLLHEARVDVRRAAAVALRRAGRSRDRRRSESGAVAAAASRADAAAGSPSRRAVRAVERADHAPARGRSLVRGGHTRYRRGDGGARQPRVGATAAGAGAGVGSAGRLTLRLPCGGVRRTSRHRPRAPVSRGATPGPDRLVWPGVPGPRQRSVR